MKIQIRIPNGFRRLRRSERIKKGDLYGDTDIMEWCETKCSGDILTEHMESFYRYIRKVKK